MDFLNKALAKLEPLSGPTPVLESKFRIILEGEFKQTVETLWSAIEAISSGRFEFNRHIEAEKLVLTGKSISSIEN